MKIPSLFLSLSLLLIGFLNSSAQTSDNYQTYPGTDVQINIPEGFELITEIPAFVNPHLSVNITVLQQAGTPYATVVPYITESYYEGTPNALVGSEKVPAGSLPGVFYYFEFTTGDEENPIKGERLSLLTGDQQNAIFIDATYLAEDREAMIPYLKEVLLTAKW